MSRWTLKPGAKPSLNLYNSSKEPPSREPPTPRNSAEKPPAKKRIKYEDKNNNNVDNFLPVTEETNVDILSSPLTKTVETQTDFSYVHSPFYIPNETDIHLNYDHPYSSHV